MFLQHQLERQHDACKGIQSLHKHKLMELVGKWNKWSLIISSPAYLQIYLGNYCCKSYADIFNTISSFGFTSAHLFNFMVWEFCI